jgi:hypothetical protein
MTSLDLELQIKFLGWIVEGRPNHRIRLTSSIHLDRSLGYFEIELNDHEEVLNEDFVIFTALFDFEKILKSCCDT